MKKLLRLTLGLLMAAASCFAAEQLIKVPFELGPTHFTRGDEIVIEQVLATSAGLGAGDTVTVRGRYTLMSAERARLCLYLTTDSSAGPEPEFPTQKTTVKRGSGTFELTKTLKNPGRLHLGFYGGGSSGTVYFGTKQQMEEMSHRNHRG